MLDGVLWLYHEVRCRYPHGPVRQHRPVRWYHHVQCIDTRMTKEILPWSRLKIKIVAPPERKYSVCIGGKKKVTCGLPLLDDPHEPGEGEKGEFFFKER